MRLYFIDLPCPGRDATWLAQPVFGIPEEDPNELFAGIMRKFHQEFSRLFEVVGAPEGADAAVLRHNWNSYDEEGRRTVRSLVERMRRAGVPTIIFYPTEGGEAVDWPRGAVVFRYNLYRSRPHPAEYAMPLFSCNDFPASYPEISFETRRWSRTPSVSFCGYAPPHGLPAGMARIKSLARLILYRTGFCRMTGMTPGHAPRAVAVRELMRTKGVEARFTLRSFFAYGGQWGQLRPGGTYESARRLRLEYARNMADADYALSVRGVTNSSIRCYEALSCGRVPLFVDTDCRLPGDFMFDWRGIMPWVEERDIPRIGRKLLEYHAGLDDERFAELQRKCRSAYEEWIAPEGFFARLRDHVEHFRRSGGLS